MNVTVFDRGMGPSGTGPCLETGVALSNAQRENRLLDSTGFRTGMLFRPGRESLMRHTTHTLVIAILVLATAHASGEPFLSAPFLSFDIGGPPSTFLSFPFPPQAWGIATADFNRDGHLDLAVSEPRRSYVSILLGDGRGSFATGGSFSTGGEPRGVLVADLNSDGIPDLITSNYRADAVSVLLGIGDGTFRPATRAPISGGGSAIGTRTADFNNDGHVDIAVASLGSFPGISISLGKGDGSFNFPTQVVHGVRPLSLATGDLNDDGNQDIIYANDEVPDTMFVLLGDGLGSFSERAILATGILTPALHLADVNGDHVLDVLALSSGNTVGSSGVLVFRGKGDGTFAPPDRVSSASTTIGDFMASDVNRDGMVDLIVPDDFTSRLNVLLGNGNGSFYPNGTAPTERTPFSVAAGDFNEDGRPDLATANRMPGTVSVLLGNGDGAFGRDDQVPVGSFPFALAAHDLDGDGRPDMACANYGSSTVSVIRSIGGRSFAPRVDVPAPSGPDAVRIADLDGDSYPDLIIAGYDANTLSVWHGDRSGGLTGRVDLPTPPAPNAVAIADLNLDGSPDMTVVGGDGSYACAFVVDGLRRRAGSVNEGGIATYLGSDRGAILTGPTVRTGNFLSSVACSDLNGDHIPDMAFTDGRPGTVSVAFGHGDGSYAPPSIVANLRHAIAVAIADLNRDGIPDLAIGEID